MANAFYDKYRQATIDWTASGVAAAIQFVQDNIKAVLVDSGAYTRNLATDQFLSDIPAGARIATSGNMTGKSSTAGVLDADDVTWPLISGVQSEYVVLYKDTGAAGTSPLICCIDTATGLPVTPSGGDITVVWDNGANKIGKI